MSAQSEVFLNWASCWTPAGLTFGACHHHTLVKSTNLIHSDLGDVYSLPKVELSS